MPWRGSFGRILTMQLEPRKQVFQELKCSSVLLLHWGPVDTVNDGYNGLVGQMYTMEDKLDLVAESYG